MAITFPLSLASFADTLGIQQVKWSLQDNRELSGVGSGQLLQADLAPSLWTADVTLRPWRTNDARKIEAKLNVIIRSMGSFYLGDPRKCVPASDPHGTALGASTVAVNSLPNAATISLKGLPAHYQLTAGDYLSFDYGDPARRAFHEISEDIEAGSDGITEPFNVSPFVRPGAVADISVTLVKPAMKAIIKPGSVEASYSAGFTTIGFSVIQKL